MLILYQVERWLRLRRQSCLPSKLQKFQETGWRCLFYLSALFYFSTKKSNLIFSCWWLFYVSALFYGIFCLWEKPWFHSINHCWDGYPYHKVCNGNIFSFLTDCNPGGAGCLVLLHGRTLFLWDSLNQVEFYFGCNGAQLLLLMALPAWHCSHISENFIAVNSLDVCSASSTLYD